MHGNRSDAITLLWHGIRKAKRGVEAGVLVTTASPPHPSASPIVDHTQRAPDHDARVRCPRSSRAANASATNPETPNMNEGKQPESLGMELRPSNAATSQPVAGAFRYDVVAGLTAAAVVLPKAMAYAAVAGLPVAVGLYTAFVPMIVYALLGTSRVLSVSSTTTLAILAGTQLGAGGAGRRPGQARHGDRHADRAGRRDAAARAACCVSASSPTSSPRRC